MRETQIVTVPVRQRILRDAVFPAVVSRAEVFAPGSRGNGAQLFLRQLISDLFRKGEEFFRGLCGFELLLLFVGQGTEDVFGNVHGEILLIIS